MESAGKNWDFALVWYSAKTLNKDTHHLPESVPLFVQGLIFLFRVGVEKGIESM